MKTLKWICAGLVIVTIIGQGVAQTQEAANYPSILNLIAAPDPSAMLPLCGTNMTSLRKWSDDQLTVLVGALNEVPTIPFESLPTNRLGRPMGGTFWSMNQPGVPFPADTAGVDLWRLADGSYLMNDLNVDYTALSASPMGMGAMDSGSPGPPGFGDGGGTYSPDGLTNSYFTFNPGTNLWISIAQMAAGSSYMNGIISNTTADAQMELQYTFNLTQPWQSANPNWFVYGSELTNWTVWIEPAISSSNLFLRLRSWQSSDGTDIPDWWEQLTFGTNTVNPDAQDGIGDGYTIYQKYEMNIALTTWVTPLAPPAFSVFYNSRYDTVTVTWQPSQGNVTGYIIERYNPNYPVWDSEGYQSFSLPSTATNFVDNSPITVFTPENGEPTYGIYAIYSNRESAYETLTMFNSGTTVPAQIMLGSHGENELLIPGPVPSGTTALMLTRSDFNWDTYEYTEATFNLPLNSLQNNSAALPAAWFDGSSLRDADEDWYVQTINGNGSVSDMTQADSLWWSQGFQENQTPFYDGREQMAQNASFLLRAANNFSQFSYNNWAYYGYAGLYDVTYIASPYCNFPAYGNLPPTLDTFRPFVENYFYYNFVFSVNDLDPTTGYLTTGLGLSVTLGPTGTLGPYEPFSTVTMSATPTYQFQLTETNTATIQAILDPSQTPWTSCYPQSETNVDWPYMDALSCDGVSDANSNYYSMTTISSNFYGLQFVTARFAYNTNGSLQTQILNAGGTISPVPTGGLFSQTAIPQLKTVDYYFAQPQSYPLPGSYLFTPDLPNNTNDLVAGFGQTNLFAGYAKQVLLNGYPNVYSYLGQYFQAAYQIDGDGNVTTNSAGVISPYGVFVPTIVGPVALVTMTNWGESAQGTGIVQVVKLVLDVNHDGVMDLSVNGPDNTSANSPYVFWCNNNYDRWDHDGNFFNAEQDDQEVADCPAYAAINTPDYNYSNFVSDGFVSQEFRTIPCTRDLEDFARLWIAGMTTNLIAALPQDSTLTLSWGDLGNPNSANPTIDLFMAADNAGGIGYQTNETVATLQTNAVQCPYIGRLNPGQSIQLSYFDTNGNPASLGNYFIWCGVSNGTGGLTLTIADGNGNTLAQTTAYIQIVDIKQMYERWTVGDNSLVPATNTAILAPDYPTNSMTSPFKYPLTQDTNTPYILHVHGYNMATWEKDRFAETAFKRLYWQGYQGRFGAFNWPTAAHALQFGASEGQAWNSAQGLLNKLKDLNTEYPGHVYLMAHSLGNVVAGEALRLAGSNQVVNTYVAMQGAVSAHAYDPTTTEYMLTHDWGAPDCYAHYWISGAPCYFNSSVGAGTYVNLYNTNDWALNNAWLLFQNAKPILDLNYSFIPPDFYYKNSGSTELFFPGNTYELFDEIIQSRSYALGMQRNVGGVFLNVSGYNQVNLPSTWPPDTSGNNYGAHIWHSAEFRSDNPQRSLFWDMVLYHMGLKKSL
jgi:hypothetical protein